MSFRVARTNRLSKGRTRGFTLVELMTVLGIMVVLTAFALPAFTSLLGAGNMTSASYAISGAIQSARAYAMAHDTYTWLGFYEEDGSQRSTNPATAGTGRLILSMVASTDGTMIYSGTSTTTLPSSRLVQINELLRVPSVHLIAGSATPARPPLSNTNGCIGTSSTAGATPFFQYPLTATSNPQYTFQQVLQFSPRGEVLVSNMAGVMTPLIDICLQPARGNTLPNSKDYVALQIAGISGNVILYRQ